MSRGSVIYTPPGGSGSGTPGADGKTWLNGSGAPGSIGTVGDYYMDTTAHAYYGPKTVGGWGSAISLIGPAGTNGTNGSNGAAGADGKTLRNGAGPPGGGVGVDGDFYVDTTNWALYGPKASGAWSSGQSFAPLGNTAAKSGFITRAYDEAAPGQSSSANGTAGTIYLIRMELPDAPTVITNMHIALATAATSPTNAFLGIYDSSGTRQLVSTDQSATGVWTATATAMKTVTGASAATWSKGATINDFCWLAVLTGAASPMPGFFRANNSNLSIGRTSGATSRWGAILTGQTALPTSITPSSITATGSNAYWGALS